MFFGGNRRRAPYRSQCLSWPWSVNDYPVPTWFYAPGMSWCNETPPKPEDVRPSVHSPISGRLTSMQKFIPKDFCRKPRGMQELDIWKARAQNFSTVCLYVGRVALHHVVSGAMYGYCFFICCYPHSHQLFFLFQVYRKGTQSLGWLRWTHQDYMGMKQLCTISIILYTSLMT